MIAALPMYDRPETAAANDRLWAGIRQALGFGPAHLTRDRDLWDIWQDPDLVLAQTCGLPFRTKLKDQVTLVGSPDYGLQDCPAGYYNSVLIGRADDDRPLNARLMGRVAINERLSQSGCAALYCYAEQAGLTLGNPIWTGAHRASIAAVAASRADLAAVDAKTWFDAERFGQETCGLKVLARTPPTPALPFITAQPDLAEPLRVALTEAIGGLDDATRMALGLKGLRALPASAYFDVPTPDQCRPA